MSASTRKIRQQAGASMFRYVEKIIRARENGKSYKLLFYVPVLWFHRLIFRITGGKSPSPGSTGIDLKFPELLESRTRRAIKRLVGLSILPGPHEFYSQKDVDRLKKYSFAIRTSGQPEISIIIPVYNNYSYTFNCLLSLHNILERSPLLVEVIVINDNSTDATNDLLAQVKGIRVINNAQNLGYLKSCNRGVAEAKGKYILHLNNDIQANSDFIQPLKELLESDSSIGVVGGKLVYPNGLLQEAGCLVFADGNGLNLGRREHPDRWEYNHTREVDYCSAALLMIRKTDWDSIGGYDEQFAPAYCEDSDICFAVKYKLGKKVKYTPLSTVLHFEGVSNGPVKGYQAQNTEKFRVKWKKELHGRISNYQEFHQQHPNKIRREDKPMILVINPSIPEYDKDSGSNQLVKIIDQLTTMADVYLFPDDFYPKWDSPYARDLIKRGCRIIYRHPSEKSPSSDLSKFLDEPFDYTWIIGFYRTDKYFDLVREKSRSKIIYDTLDLHFLRMQRSNAIQGKKDPAVEEIMRKETGYIKKADISFVVSPVELKMLLDMGITRVYFNPSVFDLSDAEGLSFAERKDLLFIGGFNHAPNTDAVKWLHDQIMPIVWQKDPSIKVSIVGSHPPPEILALHSDQFRILGFVKNVEPLFLEHKIFICPLRFGAGIKGKIGQSLSYRLPVITTQVGAEGMGIENRTHGMIEDEAVNIANAILELYHQEELWNRIHNNSHAALKPFSKEAAFTFLKKLVGGKL